MVAVLLATTQVQVVDAIITDLVAGQRRHPE
jgi:hypothetical protein